MQLHNLSVQWKIVFLRWWFRKSEGSRYSRQIRKLSLRGWACLALCGWMLAVVGTTGFLLRQAFLLLRRMETSDIQMTWVNCENAFGTCSRRNSLLTAKSFTCPYLAFLAGDISMSVDTIRYFCVICFLLALWFKGSVFEWSCITAAILAKSDMYLQTFWLHSVRRSFTAMIETKYRNSDLFLVGFDRGRRHFVDGRTAADLSTHNRV